MTRNPQRKSKDNRGDVSPGMPFLAVQSEPRVVLVIPTHNSAPLSMRAGEVAELKVAGPPGRTTRHPGGEA